MPLKRFMKGMEHLETLAVDIWLRASEKCLYHLHLKLSTKCCF